MKFIVIPIVLLSLFGVFVLLWTTIEEPHKLETGVLVFILLFLPTILAIGRHASAHKRE